MHAIANLALDFVNTESRRPDREDVLHSPEMLVAWLIQAFGPGRVAPPTSLPEQRIVLDEAGRLRRAIVELFVARRDGVSPSESVVFAVNRALEAGRASNRLQFEDGIPWLETVHAGGGPLAMLAPIALAGAELVRDVDPARLRACASDDCGTWFVDTSKGGRRRWCSMERCGNRAKSARFRKRAVS